MEKCRNKFCHHNNLEFDNGCDLEWDNLSDCNTHKQFNNLFDEIDQAAKEIKIKDDMPKELEENIGQAELKAVKDIIVWKQWFMRTNILFAISQLLNKTDAK